MSKTDKKPSVKTTEEAPQTELSDTEMKLSKSHQQWPFDNGQFAPFHSLRREVDDIFNQFSDRFGVFNKAPLDTVKVPALDFDETENSYEIFAELPGMSEDDIEISLTDNLLTIRGEKQETSEKEVANRRISECSYGVFERSLTLPFNCDAESVEAQLENGILHLSIPFPEEKRVEPQKIAIKKAA